MLSRPTSLAPPSRTASILPSISFITCCAVVGLGEPEIFAEGAARTVPDSRIIACAVLWLGKRIATVSSPAETSFGITSDFFIIIVSGPGQNASASFFAVSGIFVTRLSLSISEKSQMWTISGLSPGLPFALKIFFTASGLSASAASP